MNSEVVDTGAVAASETSTKGRPSDRRVFLEKSLTLIVFGLVFVAFAIWLQGTFVNVDARMLDVHQNVPVLILALAGAVVLLGRHFDLSIGSMATLSAFLCVGLAINEGWPFWLVLVACLVVGAIGGLLNAFLVVRLKVDSFIATLGSGSIFVGLSAVYSGGAMLTPTAQTGSLPSWFTGPGSLGAFGAHAPAIVLWIVLAGAGVLAALSLASTRIFKRLPKAVAIVISLIVVALVAALIRVDLWVATTSWAIGILLFITLILWVVGKYTTFGRHLRATGANPRAARLAGVAVGRKITGSYVISGLLSATAGILLAANLGAANQHMAVPYLLPAYAAAFLSTVILSRGHVTMWGTVVGGVFVVWVAQGLLLGGLNFTWTEVVNGAVLVFAVALSSVLARKH